MAAGSAPVDLGHDDWIVRPAPAKLNLYLRVVGRRADGYHDLDSLVAFASPADRVRVRPADGTVFTVDGPFADRVPSGRSAGDNLAVRAASMLADALGRPADAAIDLHKCLPAAAGLGGGSADAAAALRALAALWGIAEDDRRLYLLAARLGADVPVCLAGRTSRILGIGDRIEPAAPVSGVAVVLANPLVPVATPAVFRALDGPFCAPLPVVDPPSDPAGLAQWLRRHGNDLQAPALRLAPVIGEVIAALDSEPGCLLARMSGSGASCFGLFDGPAAAERAAARIASARTGWWVRPGRLL